MSPEKVNPGVWIAIFLVVIVLINMFGVQLFGELEFWMSTTKVVILIGVIILSLVLACGGGPNRDASGFRYWSNPGAFNHFITSKWSCSLSANLWSWRGALTD